MLFRDQEQRRKFSSVLVFLGSRAGDGDGHTLRRLGEDLMAPSLLNGIGIVEALTQTSSTTMRQLLVPIIIALAHGPEGIDAWMLKNRENVDAAREWLESIVRAAPAMRNVPQDNGLSLQMTGIPPQVTG